VSKPQILEGHIPVRVTVAFNMLLALPGVDVTAVELATGRVIIDVRLRRRLTCPHCDYTTAARHNWQAATSTWRALDLGVWRVTVRAQLRRLALPRARRRGRGRPLRAPRRALHPRHRRPRRLAGDQDGQDRRDPWSGTGCKGGRA
jgi:CelD/BcsL family acetyltransferase involved in cellulose biosynthesis